MTVRTYPVELSEAELLELRQALGDQQDRHRRDEDLDTQRLDQKLGFAWFQLSGIPAC